MKGEIRLCYRFKTHFSLHNWQNFSPTFLRILATLRNKRKLAAVSKESPENTRNSQSQSTLDPGMVEEYISQVSEDFGGTVTGKLPNEFSWTESRSLGALSKLDDFFSEPTSSEMFHSCSGNTPEKRLRKPGTQCGLFPRQPLSRGGVPYLPFY